MIVLINLSNLSVGGGVQVGISFIQEISKLSEGDQYHVVVNDKVRSLIGNSIISNEIHFHSVKNSPAQLNTRRIIVNQLRKIEREVCPEALLRNSMELNQETTI
ncbi:hypothetical protein CTH30272_03310 [Allocatenococcus thiocycli]|nr:hypothetical protein CTH30272_03310 [Catenococcus thiocycli]